MTKDYLTDAVKLIEAIQEREDCISDDEINSLSPSYGQAIIEQLEKEGGLVWTQDGWFVNDSGSLKHFRNKYLSELENLNDKEKDFEIKEKTLHYTKLDNIRGWVALGLSLLSIAISICALCRTL